MDKQQLHQLLAQLHTELAQAQSVEAEERELLKGLQADVQAILERSEDAPAQQYQSLGAQLQAAIRAFEVSHPTLTWTMGEVLEILSRSGI